MLASVTESHMLPLATPGGFFSLTEYFAKHQRYLLRESHSSRFLRQSPIAPESTRFRSSLRRLASSPSCRAFAAHARNTLTRPSHALVLRVSNLGSLGSSGCSVMVLDILCHGPYLAGSAAPSKSLA
jgi:hypothetical protein